MKAMTAGIILLLFLQTNSDKLEAVVANQNQRILYVGSDNILGALIEKNSKESVYLTTDNGEIAKIGGTSFAIRPKHSGSAKITISKISKRDTTIIDVVHFEVRELPKPVALMGFKKMVR